MTVSIPPKLAADVFHQKIKQIHTDLTEGKWLNEQMETQDKNNRFVRWIKCILSIILPVDLFSSIKVDTVAIKFFKFVQNHKEWLSDNEILENVRAVLLKLEEKTKEKHTETIVMTLTACDGLLYQPIISVPVKTI
jgi:hypothetical protein